MLLTPRTAYGMHQRHMPTQPVPSACSPASGRGALDAARDRTPVGGGYALLESRTMTWLQRHAGNGSVSRLLAVQRWGDVDAGLRTCHREDTEAPPVVQRQHASDEACEKLIAGGARPPPRRP